LRIADWQTRDRVSASPTRFSIPNPKTAI